jgi:hypothetical protein
MAFQPMPLFLSLCNQIAPVLANPLRRIKRGWKREEPGMPPPTMATYIEAANKFTKAAVEFMEYARLLTGARNAYQLQQKQVELVRLHREIDSLKLVIPLLLEDSDVSQTEDGRSRGSG